MTPINRNADNRRLAMRITTSRILTGWCDMAARLDLDLIEMLVFTGIWTANTDHLNQSADRYARLLDLPPDSQRRPIALSELATRLRLAPAVCAATVERLAARTLVETIGSGLVVPAAVFTREEMLSALTDGFERVRDLGRVLDELSPRAANAEIDAGAALAHGAAR